MENEIYVPEAEVNKANALGEEINESETSEESLEIAEEIETPDIPDSDRLEALLKHERIASEYAEFSELFPGVSISSLPDSVTESVKSGIPIAAAYALYHYKKEAAISAAAKINSLNSERSFALKKNDFSDAYFSPAEVKEMSAAEVKANYKKIIDSMSHWH